MCYSSGSVLAILYLGLQFNAHCQLYASLLHSFGAGCGHQQLARLLVCGPRTENPSQTVIKEERGGEALGILQLALLAILQRRPGMAMPPPLP